MIDTNPAIESKTRALMMNKSPEERLIIGCSMFTFAKTIVRSSIIQKNSNIPLCDLNKELFLRFYGNDMDKKTRERIAFCFSG